MPRAIRKITRELKKGLAQLYGDQLCAVYLFGSYARGEGHIRNSDIDVMVVLKDEFKRREVEARSIEFVASLCLEYDVVIMCKFITAQKYAESNMPFMVNVRRDAVAI
ncbi:MAG: hypothetical protein JETCAE01_13830 [Anaerolineaceae bacterium]|nr:MAG: nucleotidyltransferase domain-containing protein [Chloroflexota bacterium]GJQ35373.1 MAG: hypothetical protein JETCAE01_13830 [Anaerolineaceae bacterium]